MSLIRRIWDVWTNTAQQELILMLDEFAEDYSQEERFLSVFGLLEDALIDEDYERATLLFERYAPDFMRPVDRELFFELLLDAQYGY